MASGSLEEYVFIGIRDHITEGDWKTTESNYQCIPHFTNWNPGQPNNYGGQDCGTTRKSMNWRWDDRECFLKYHFVCQFFE